MNWNAIKEAVLTALRTKEFWIGGLCGLLVGGLLF